jgi:hypothetical protein
MGAPLREVHPVGNVKADKEKSAEPIDGMVSPIEAVGRILFPKAASALSIVLASFARLRPIGDA